MSEVFGANKEAIISSCKTEAGPLTDGKKKRVTKTGVQKSFNDKFCKEYFQHEAVRESFFYYL